jgi:alkylhydroperoxidase family enzyme
LRVLTARATQGFATELTGAFEAIPVGDRHLTLPASPPAELSATVRIAAKLAEKLEAVVDDYFAALRAVGFDDGQIIEIVLQVGLNTG